MKLTIDSADLQKVIAEMIEYGLDRDGWIPTKKARELYATGADTDRLRKNFATERANNIVCVLTTEQTLDEEESEAA